MPYPIQVSCRLSEADRELLDQAAEKSGLTQSQYMRALLRLQDPSLIGTHQPAYAIDSKTMAHLALELVRWGRHYNQAVHAMNTIALFIRRGNPTGAPEMEAHLADIGNALREVEEGRQRIEYALVEISESAVVGSD